MVILLVWLGPGLWLQLSESLTKGTVPFDAASETPLEEQRTEAMARIQDALLAHQGPEALSLLRAARSAWKHLSIFYWLCAVRA